MNNKSNTKNPNLAPDELETDDIYIAGYLSVAGCELRRRRKEGPKVYFIFHNPVGDIRKLREAYFMGAKVNAVDFANAIRKMKELLYD